MKRATWAAWPDSRKNTTSSGVPCASCTKRFAGQNADQSRRGWRVRQKTAEAEIAVVSGDSLTVTSATGDRPGQAGTRGGTDASSCRAPWPDCHCGGQPRRRDASGAGHDHRPHDKRPPRRQVATVIDVFVEIDVGQGAAASNRGKTWSRWRWKSANIRNFVSPAQAYQGTAQHLRSAQERRQAGTRAVESVGIARQLIEVRHETRLGDGCRDRRPGRRRPAACGEVR